MKNKKGFTLIELLVVIIILVSVAGTTIIGIDEITKQTQEKELKNIINEIELATDVYINSNEVYRKSLLNGEITEKCTRVYVLQNENLIDLDLKNPVTNKRIPGNLCVYSRVDEDGIIKHIFTID